MSTTSAERMRLLRSRRRDSSWNHVTTEVPTQDNAALLYALARHFRDGLSHEEALARLVDLPACGGVDPIRLAEIRRDLDDGRADLLRRFAAILEHAGDDRLSRLSARVAAMESWLGII